MKVGDCPSCRAPVEFRPGAGQVKVCEYCNTVVFRGEVKLESLGKVAELMDTQSPLKVGLSGRYSGTPFTVAGRIQKSNATGTWDEWFLQFEDERQGWLAESEGEWKILFPMTNVAPPKCEALQVLGSFTLRDKTFVVEEKNAATTVAAQGQLPDFNRQHLYVDATGPKGIFCTLDEAGGQVEAFVGSFTTLQALGFDPSELEPTPKKEALRQARCTNCNGPLELKAPDATKRVACPYCGALLEVQGGALNFLELLEKPPFEPRIPLGATGKLHDPTVDKPQGPPPEWTCLAFLVRSCTVEGTRYPWDEYLLWNQVEGFRWLMHSNGHWTWLTPVPAGDVELAFRQAKYGGQTYRGYQSVYAVTEYVAGECYWQVRAGEMALASEFIAPPRSINCDQTETEATFTRGVMVENALLEKTFALEQKLNPPVGIAPAQPNVFSKKAGEAWAWAGIWGAALLLLIVVFSVMGSTEEFYRGHFSVPPAAGSASAEAQRFSEPFEIKKSVPLEVKIEVPGLSNNWLGVSIDLVNEKTGEVVAVYGETEYYSGVSDGESWSEGSRSVNKQTDVVEAGTYVLRATPSFEPARAVDYDITVAADDGAGACCPLFLFLLLLAAPLYYSLRANGFETSKWNDAVFQSSPGVSTFPYAKNDDDE
ncbi:MAG: zinc finger domain-containing protein [Myxococcota bacterium]